WFTDEYALPSAAEMVVGTLEFKITDACVLPGDGEEGESGGDSQTLEWKAGECRELSWTFENTGTKTAFFRARPEGIFTGYTYTKKESAWGEGYDFPGGNWAMYFKHNKGSVTETRLLAGQHHDAGKVRVWEESGKLKVRYETNANWMLTETKMAVADKMENFPKKGKNPPPGQFPNKSKHNPVRSYTHEIKPIPGYDPIYIAAHADLVGAETEGNVTDDYDKITWSLPDGSPWKEGVDSKGKHDGWFYYCQPVKSGETITLVLRGCLDEDAADGSYEVKLKAESVQTTHGAAEEIWPNWPGE
ncbi:MAG: hypothetical protein ACOX6X_05035, partial [Dethiobacteria bacterium]